MERMYFRRIVFVMAMVFGFFYFSVNASAMDVLDGICREVAALNDGDCASLELLCQRFNPVCLQMQSIQSARYTAAKDYLKFNDEAFLAICNAEMVCEFAYFVKNIFTIETMFRIFVAKILQIKDSPDAETFYINAFFGNLAHLSLIMVNQVATIWQGLLQTYKDKAEPLVSCDLVYKKLFNDMNALFLSVISSPRPISLLQSFALPLEHYKLEELLLMQSPTFLKHSIRLVDAVLSDGRITNRAIIASATILKTTLRVTKKYKKSSRSSTFSFDDSVVEEAPIAVARGKNKHSKKK